MNMKNKIKTLGIIVPAAIALLVITACYDQNQKVIDTSQYYLSAPTGVSATKTGNNPTTINLTWDAVSGVERYEISYRTNLDSEATRRNVSSHITVTSYGYSYYASYITAGVTTYYFYIKAHPRLAGYIASDWSNPVSVSVP
jgi:hypothetical protein